MTKSIEAPGFVLPGIEDITRRDFLVGGAAALLLGGCGSSGGGEASGETRTVEDGAGRSVDVPVEPQRVVVVDPNRVLFHLVELGITPVGATTNPTTTGGEFSPLLGEAGKDVGSVGDMGSPSLERIAALEPDLILFTAGYSELTPERLAEIAPTLVYDAENVSLDVEESLRSVANFVSRQAEAEELISSFDARLEEAASRLDFKGRTFSLPLTLNYEANPTFTVYGPETPLGRIIERLGGEIVPKEINGEPVEEFSADLSLERVIDFVDADTVILLRYFDDSGEMDENFESVIDTPVWQAVPAIERKDVIVLDLQPVSGSYGFAGLEQVLDTLAEEFSR